MKNDLQRVWPTQAAVEPAEMLELDSRNVNITSSHVTRESLVQMKIGQPGGKPALDWGFLSVDDPWLVAPTVAKSGQVWGGAATHLQANWLGSGRSDPCLWTAPSGHSKLGVNFNGTHWFWVFLHNFVFGTPGRWILLLNSNPNCIPLGSFNVIWATSNHQNPEGWRAKPGPILAAARGAQAHLSRPQSHLRIFASPGRSQLRLPWMREEGKLKTCGMDGSNDLHAHSTHIYIYYLSICLSI